MPSPKNMNANRFGGVLRAGCPPATALSDSSHGRATVAARPFKTTRRDICCVLIESPPVSQGMRLKVYHGRWRLYTDIQGFVESRVQHVFSLPPFGGGSGWGVSCSSFQIISI